MFYGYSDASIIKLLSVSFRMGRPAVDDYDLKTKQLFKARGIEISELWWELRRDKYGKTKGRKPGFRRI